MQSNNIFPLENECKSDARLYAISSGNISVDLYWTVRALLIFWQTLKPGYLWITFRSTAWHNSGCWTNQMYLS